ncbi:MAG: hypothetical protein L6R48_21010 [Planctomycetes bacterium]|nr:hypothetical protein [Planctomycetota bacterium]
MESYRVWVICVLGAILAAVLLYGSLRVMNGMRVEGRFEEVEIGMSRPALVELVGEPAGTAPAAGGGAAQRLLYPGPPWAGETWWVEIRDGVVVAKGSQ